MTTAQLDHLRAIDAHLAKLLDIAAKRTPGEWYVTCMARIATLATLHVPAICQLLPELEEWTQEQRANGNFIASCAGNAEAGWRSTRAAIAVLTRLNKESELYEGHGGSLNAELESILAEWPIELITKPQ